MEHLPCPIDGRRPEVPFFAARKVYRPEDFFRLPKEHGYADFHNLLEDGLERTMQKGDANHFLQTWLFFSLLAQVLSQEIDYRDFLQNSNNTLHTRKLNAMLQNWAIKESTAVEEGMSREQRERYLRASMALVDARRFVSKHCSYQRLDRNHHPLEDRDLWKKDNPVHQALDAKMTLSLAILGETLQQARPDMMPHLEGHFRFWRDPRVEEKRWGCSKYCREQMKTNGYDELEICRIEAMMPSVSIVYYCSSMASRTQRSGKGPLHMNPCRDGCETHHIGDDEIIKAIEEGKTPLVTWGSSGLEWKAYDLKRDHDIQFGVLSHAWEEEILDCGKDARPGHNRRMYECQLITLQETFDKMVQNRRDSLSFKNTPFWVDALCLPRESGPKGKAINQMRDIYAKAAVVLVWQRELLQTNKLAESDSIETNMRIRTSNWASRLWTMQEAVLGGIDCLHVAFQNRNTIGINELRSARDRARRDPNDPYHHIWEAGYPFSKSTWALRRSNEFRVHRTWLAVQFREVLEPQDEALILGSVLGVDVVKIQKIGQRNEPPKQIAAKRMVKLLDLLDSTPGLGIPSGIIFLPTGKLSNAISETKGYGWAPATWLTKQLHDYPLFRPAQQSASIGKWGLLVQFPGLILHWPKDPVASSKFWISVHQCMHKWFKIVADTGGVDWETFWANEVCTQDETFIILSTSNPRDKWEIGLLVQSKGVLSQGEVRWVKTLCRVWIRLEANPDIIARMVQGVRERGNGMLFGERLGDQQRWCIDGGEE
ncbi:hypothetical protein M501DRAFT_995692 [Patellaria atrata CBS 101060]|uniref:Heterokaryon incompatibility domain-containing protein n=1 Tax=Patellaria atrata CBS 101060 TaxID=1346257 RepID=A0A9P4VMY6_9PEZI|nr:hypothetical protein M501DRAFT_995692 [Patellaria atrata CBS 101060]